MKSANQFSRRQPSQKEKQSYRHRVLQGPCFICEIVAHKKPTYQDHHLIYEDESAVVFLNKYPVLYGYVLVAPREHREGVTTDISEAEYLLLQQLIYRVADAVQRVVPTERLYILSLGSQQGNSHVHWHVAPLPPGVPFDDQQFAILQGDKGIYKLPYREMAALADRIKKAMGLLPLRVK